MRTDIHTHVFHPAVASKALARLAGLGFCPAGSGMVEDLLARARAAGMKRVVVHNVATAPAQMTPVNNYAMTLQREHAAITAFGSVHPAGAGWERELDRLRAAGIPGLKWHPNFQELGFDDPALFPVIEAAQNDFIFMCHVGCEEPLLENPASPYKLRDLVRRFPKARFIAAHMGGYLNAAAALDALAGLDIWLDCSNTDRFSDAELRTLCNAHSRERVLFGSDYPLFDPATHHGRIQQRLRLTDAEMDALTNNADALLSSISPLPA